MKNSILLITIILLFGCGKRYVPPTDGPMSTVTFINNTPLSAGLFLYEDFVSCGEVRGLGEASLIRPKQNIKLVIDASKPFTYKHAWGYRENFSTKSIGRHAIEISYDQISCFSFKTFTPEPNIDYYIEIKSDGISTCATNIYSNTKTNEAIETIDRIPTMPLTSSGNWCLEIKPEDLNAINTGSRSYFK